MEEKKRILNALVSFFCYFMLLPLAFHRLFSSHGHAISPRLLLLLPCRVFCVMSLARCTIEFTIFFLSFLHSSAFCTHAHDTLNCMCRAQHHPLCRLHNDDDETLKFSQQHRELGKNQTNILKFLGIMNLNSNFLSLFKTFPLLLSVRLLNFQYFSLKAMLCYCARKSSQCTHIGPHTQFT